MQFARWLFAAILYFSNPLLALADNWHDGKSAYDRGDYANALRFLMPLAQEGRADAQSVIGWMFLRGEGVVQDYFTAVRWFRKAAEQGNVTAQYNMGLAYYNGSGVPLSHKDAMNWWLKAAEQGSAEAQASVGVMYEGGDEVTQDFAKAVQWYQRAASAGQPMAQTLLAEAYSAGRGIAQSDTEALKWYRKAASSGNAIAQLQLGSAIQDGRGTERNSADAAEWFRKAADQGNATAQYKLGLMYQNGDGVPQDDQEALRLYQLSVVQTDSPPEVRQNLEILEAKLNAPKNDKTQESDALELAQRGAEEMTFIGGEPYGEFGGWQITDHGGTFCLASTGYDDGTLVWLGIQGAQPSFFAAFANSKWKSIESGKEYQIEVRYGRKVWQGKWLGFSFNRSGGIRIADIAEKFVGDFARSAGFEIRYRDKSLARLSLKGSRTALSKLIECYGNRVKKSESSSDPFAEESSDPFSSSKQNSSNSNDGCDEKFLRANAIFMRATTHCLKNYLDSKAGYYALEMSKKCLNSWGKKIESSSRKVMLELDEMVDNQGKTAACRFVDQVEEEILREVEQNSPNSPLAQTDAEIVFSGSGIQIQGKPEAHLRIGEKLSVEEINSRFVNFQSSPSNECEGFCIELTDSRSRVSVYYDKEKSVVLGIVAWCDGGNAVSDNRGNVCGASLAAVANSKLLKCDFGEHTTCASPDIKGLSYATAGDEGCSLDTSDGTITSLPACAKIESFEAYGSAN